MMMTLSFFPVAPVLFPSSQPVNPLPSNTLFLEATKQSKANKHNPFFHFFLFQPVYVCMGVRVYGCVCYSCTWHGTQNVNKTVNSKSTPHPSRLTPLSFIQWFVHTLGLSPLLTPLPLSIFPWSNSRKEHKTHRP